jgi:hypothetical protein
MAQKYQGRDIDAMKAVAKAHKNRSLSEFQDSLNNFKEGARSTMLEMLTLRTHERSDYPFSFHRVI